MVAYCDVRLAKEDVIGLRPRYLRGLYCGAICAAASIALGTLLSISSQAVVVLMEETLALAIKVLYNKIPTLNNFLCKRISTVIKCEHSIIGNFKKNFIYLSYEEI